MKPPARAWNGGTPATASLDTAAAMLRAHAIMRRSHAAHFADGKPGLWDAPYRCEDAPGYLYLPVEDVVIFNQTVLAIGRVFLTEAKAKYDEAQRFANAEHFGPPP
jgi:hypothetical protein